MRRTSGRVFSYLPETTLLFLVTLSGFLLEITYILSAPDPRPFAYHLVGYQTARLVAPLQWPWNNLLPVVLAVHLLLVASFFAYIPFSRLVHVMATPLGRLLNSQTAILAEKRRTVVSGLLNLEGHRLP